MKLTLQLKRSATGVRMIDFYCRLFHFNYTSYAEKPELKIKANSAWSWHWFL